MTVHDKAGEKQLNRCVHCNGTEERKLENARTSSWCEICGVCLCTKKKKMRRKFALKNGMNNMR